MPDEARPAVTPSAWATPATPSTAPAKGGLVLLSLDLVAVGYSLGIAASVVRPGAHPLDRNLVRPRRCVLVDGSLVSGLLLEHFAWGSVLLATCRSRPPPSSTIAFLVRQRRTPNPLFDLRVASRRILWVAACAGIVVFGSLMGALFIGQPYLQNVLGCSPLNAGVSITQSIFGALLTAGYAAAMATAIAGAPPSLDITTSVQTQLTMSYAGAAAIAQQYPQ